MKASAVNWACWLTSGWAASVLIAVALASVLVPVDIDRLTSDVAQVARVHPMSGAVSQLGLFGWCSAACVCAFAALILRGRGTREHYLFMLYSAFLSAWLLMDDAFLLHEWNEALAFPLLLLAVLLYLWRFAAVIRSTPYIYLLVAFVGFGLSMGIDVVRGYLCEFNFLKAYINWESWEHLCEDGPKWVGIVYWCSYYTQSAWFLIKKEVLDEAAPNHPGDPGVPAPPARLGPGS